MFKVRLSADNKRECRPRKSTYELKYTIAHMCITTCWYQNANLVSTKDDRIKETLQKIRLDYYSR